MDPGACKWFSDREKRGQSWGQLLETRNFQSEDQYPIYAGSCAIALEVGVGCAILSLGWPHAPWSTDRKPTWMKRILWEPFQAAPLHVARSLSTLYQIWCFKTSVSGTHSHTHPLFLKVPKTLPPVIFFLFISLHFQIAWAKFNYFLSPFKKCLGSFFSLNLHLKGSLPVRCYPPHLADSHPTLYGLCVIMSPGLSPEAQYLIDSPRRTGSELPPFH